MKNHHYKTKITWTGNSGRGTKDYRAYERSHTISVNEKETINASSDPSFRGDKTKYNPEELLVASLSSCHMLSYLHLCAINNIIVLAYVDDAEGTMQETDNGGGHFTEVVLKPLITISDKGMLEKATQLHHDANELCFIASSCNFPVKHEPRFLFSSEI